MARIRKSRSRQPKVKCEEVQEPVAVPLEPPAPPAVEPEAPAVQPQHVAPEIVPQPQPACYKTPVAAALPSLPQTPVARPTPPVTAAFAYEQQPVEKYHDLQAEPTRAEKSDALRIEARRRIRVKCTRQLNDTQRRERDYMWQYVDGIFENRSIQGETMTFWINPFPGDDYAEYVVPCAKAVSVPRWMAKHLNSRKHCVFKYKDKPDNRILPNEFMQDFVADYYQHRTSFMPLSAY